MVASVETRSRSRAAGGGAWSDAAARGHDFHSIQGMEAAFPMAISSGDPYVANHFMIATTRYLAAHAPTLRAQGQTFRTAERLCRGEHVFNEE